jgi:hypothetical protein
MRARLQKVPVPRQEQEHECLIIVRLSRIPLKTQHQGSQYPSK